MNNPKCRNCGCPLEAFGLAENPRWYHATEGEVIMSNRKGRVMETERHKCVCGCEKPVPKQPTRG